MHKIKLVVILVLCLASHVRAGDQQKGGQALMNPPKKEHVVKADADCPATQAVPSNVFSYQKLAKSHIKSLGQIGKTARYEIVSVKVRGLDTPNVAGFLIYDSSTDSFVGMQTAGAPGLGVALVNGGASVAGNFLFGSKLRPDNNVNNSVAGSVSLSDSESTGNSVRNSNHVPRHDN